MKGIRTDLLRPFILANFAAVFLFPASSAAAACEQWMAKMVSAQGSVLVQRVGETQWQQVKLNDTYCVGDKIQVQENSRADVALANRSVLRLNANSTITLDGIKEERSYLVGLLKGAAHFFSRRPRSLEVRTPFATAGVRGTEFYLSVEDNKTLLSIFEGHVLASNQAGSLSLTSGQSAVAEKGKAPVLRVVARPRDAVQWALYYPPVIYTSPDKLKAGVDWQRRVGTSMGFYHRGDMQQAFDAIVKVPNTIREPRFFTYRASLLLAVGRMEEANGDIERALNLNPNDSDALALQTIIAVVQNEKDKALSLARKAVEANANSATAQVALSYAQQAQFDLPDARSSLEKAVTLDPANALAWARLAEIHASFGDLGKSLKAAEQAVTLEPNLSRTQTVMGFAFLTQVKTEQAKMAFEKAIKLNQADPLPHLGLGLAKIREGQESAGNQDLEIAASLDPNNGLIRSYLGKAYFEEKRAELDKREYNIAKELDPKDPTPWFYSAIANQTTNRPVEALQDLQKAIELNDNRAVYRSKLALDSDLAARSASLGRIYSDLGFQQLALVEGWKSVNTDPSNFSAHRFLADSYSSLPRHEIARVSELLQSQLLQPVNMTPIQPRLSESNLFLVSAGGPGALSFNEFNPLFNSNGLTFQSSGLVGGNDTYSGEGIISGIYQKASFSLGYSHFESNGWRDNAYQDDDIANAFVQFELSPQTSIQAEYRYRNIKNGELQLRFDPDDFRPNRDNQTETQLGRVGFRHDFSPSSKLIGNFTYQESNRDSEDDPLPILNFDLEGWDSAFSGELQYLFGTERYKMVSGAGYFNIDSEDRIKIVLSPPPIVIPPPPFPPGLPPIVIPVAPITTVTPVDRDVEHTNVYHYSHLDLFKNVTLTVGASGDFYNSDIPGSVGTDQFNPKFGITWNPLPDTLVRGAAFRVLKRTLITDQTLEPTQVAGFNQFFDDFNATDSRRYGIAVDQKFSKQIYAGAEYTYRDLDVPFVASTATGLSARTANWRENIARGYFFWTPLDFIAFSAEYQWEKLVRDKAFADGAKTVETNLVPLGVKFFHNSGLSASLKATYVKQQGSFEPLAMLGSFVNGDDNFWVVDAALSYRLPKRYGFLTAGASNLFNENFNYFDTDRDNPRIQPDRFLFTRITLSF